MNLEVGHMYRVGPAASVQFRTPITVRIIRIPGWSTYEGWAWIDVYQLDQDGAAVERRTLFVQPAGLEEIRPEPRPAPARIPRQRRRSPERVRSAK